MAENKKYTVLPQAQARALIDSSRYQHMYKRSLEEGDSFWAEQAEEFIDWYKPWHTVQNSDFSTATIRWFEGAKLNVCYNCLDRHLEKRGDQIAYLWEGDEPGVARRISYRELHAEVSRCANAMKALGVEKGDRVCLYMPMIPEAVVAMLACARIGAVHSVVFGGFSADSLRDRINDSQCKLLVTADQGRRGGRLIPLKDNADKACLETASISHVLVVRHGGQETAWQNGRDVWYHEALEQADPVCEPEPMDAEDPLFILYTSGSTGKPKGVLHSSAGYLLYVAMTYRYIFDYSAGEIFWCAADIGWVTGHSYIVYGPLANGATSVLFEGLPTYPDAGRLWDVVDKYHVNIIYMAPTAIRTLMSKGDALVTSHSRRSLRLLGTVGEPINPEAWQWYYDIVGEGRCPIVDTWWQTETGGALITPLPGATALKPGSATLPFFGVEPALLDDAGKLLEGPAQGNLVLRRSWPGQMRTVYGDHQRFIDTYFKMYPGSYFTGDGCRRDEDGYYWITGRVDDVINVSGHRMGTAEVESALVLHKAVAEAAVVGYPHDIKGQAIYAYVTLMQGVEPTDTLRTELVRHVRSEIGPVATPDVIQWAESLPKTRSGKIMRRILRKIAANETDSLGDTTTLADPSVVDALISGRANR